MIPHPQTVRIAGGQCTRLHSITPTSRRSFPLSDFISFTVQTLNPKPRNPILVLRRLRLLRLLRLLLPLFLCIMQQCSLPARRGAIWALEQTEVRRNRCLILRLHHSQPSGSQFSIIWSPTAPAPALRLLGLLDYPYLPGISTTIAVCVDHDSLLLEL